MNDKWRRFRHPFEPTVQRDVIAHIQQSVDAYRAQVSEVERST